MFKTLHLSGIKETVTGEAWIAHGFVSINVYDKSEFITTLTIPLEDLKNLFDAVDLLGVMKLGELQRFVDWYRENQNSDNLPWNVEL